MNISTCRHNSGPTSIHNLTLRSCIYECPTVMVSDIIGQGLMVHCFEKPTDSTTVYLKSRVTTCWLLHGSIAHKAFPANTRHISKVGSMLAQRRRGWANVAPFQPWINVSCLLDWHALGFLDLCWHNACKCIVPTFSVPCVNRFPYDERQFWTHGIYFSANNGLNLFAL